MQGKIIKVRVPSKTALWNRLWKNVAWAGLILFVSLGIGMVGYHMSCPISWVQAFLNASMILTGMGPVDNPSTDGGKIFSGLYAIYSGIIFLGMSAIVLAPAMHRIMAGLHVPIDDEDNEQARNTDRKYNPKAGVSHRKPGEKP